MKKILTFSLWNNIDRYNIGAIKNAELALQYYPDFECWFYIHKETVPEKIINQLFKMKNVKIIFKEGDINICNPMTWRFEAIDDEYVEIMMSRDTDTRILLREKLAVDEWLNSDKLFHSMRDHPDHYDINYRINAGMFGTKKIPEIKSWKESLLKNLNKSANKFADQIFLNEYIYSKIINNAIIHSSFQTYKNEYTKKFPIKYCNEYKFVGEYVYEDEGRSISHINSLKRCV